MSLQNYELLGAIGQGQYGTAYKARHRLDGKLYCIKKIGFSAKEDQSGALKEVQLLSQLDHPNIIGYKESFIDQKDGALCIVTSFCDEGDLFTRIAKRKAANQLFTEQEVMDMFLQIASALAHIHQKRILHRDLKTQNIFCCAGGIIKLGDFGISKVLEKTADFATTVTGTPYYMAPEICTNQPYTFKSDIWSLGCVLYELCTLKHAFAADSLLSLVYQIVRGNFPPIPNDRFSQNLSNLVNALLVRDAAARPDLAKILAMPYVEMHMQRYMAESRRTLVKNNRTMARRQHGLNSTASSGVGSAADLQGTMNGAGGGGDDASLTPKERLARKKEAERQRRELELKLATMNMAKEQGIAAQRKAANIHGSNVHGLPGATAASAPGGGGGGDMGGLGTMAAMGALSDPSGGAGGRMGMGGDRDRSSYSPGRDADDGFSDTFVNMGTMPAGGGGTMVNMGTMPSAATQQRMAAAQAGQRTQRDGIGGQTLYEAYENRPIRASGGNKQQQQSGMYQEDDSSVMMGTIGGGGTMVNMGTVNLQGQTLGFNGGATRNSNMRSSQQGSPVVPSNMVGGYKFGITNPGSMPALPVFPAAGNNRSTTPSPQRSPSPQPAGGKIKFGVSSDSRPRGSFEYAVRDANSQSGYEDYDEGGDEYEDDFEDYAPHQQELDSDTIYQRAKILSNIEDLERTKGRAGGLAGGGEDAIAQVREKVAPSTKSNKAAALRDRCQQELGHHFADVYAFLRRTRTQEPANTDEGAVQRALFELVGQDKGLLKGCFLVDQLVFQEMMYK